ncbi:hypothetical protein [Streptococcus sp. DD13]|uniref:hypothetical protein n=1 Tax=Streptococcus sp. DD13 TaxID=1777881 RepID=UPI00079B6BAF|nr:hypothetical protein [Streptococcus sp. DD13]KXT79104.1 hypothetical protein STRDD13_00223 [Streptococcus sp. DD13]
MKFFIEALVLAGDTMTGEEVDGKDVEKSLKNKAIRSYYNLIITATSGTNGMPYCNDDLEEETMGAPRATGTDLTYGYSESEYHRMINQALIEFAEAYKNGVLLVYKKS